MQNIGTFYKNDNLFSKLEKDSTILGIKIGTTDAVKVANLNTITEIAKGNNAQEGIKALANAAISAYQDGDKEQGNQYLDALASAYTLGGSPQIGSAIDLAKNADNPVGILTEVLGTQLIGGIIAKSVGKSVDDSVVATLTLGGKNIHKVDSSVANSAYEKPPYATSKPIYDFETDGTTSYVRVYTEGSTQPSGRWMMKLEDIDGLTPQQIQDKFDLPEIPTHITDVNPPQGSKIRTGTVNSGNFGGNGGGTQFELRSTIPNESFTNRRPL